MRSSKGKIDYKVLYAKAVYGDEEKQAVMKSLDNGWLASGPLVAEFEKKVAGLFGKTHGMAVNSGSSANLLAFKILDLPEGSEVITPACTFATVVSCLLQNGLKPVFIDSVVGRYVMDETLVEKAITKSTKAIMTPHLVGGVSDLRKLRKICDKYDLFLIDDSCDTLGVKLDDKPSGFYSDISTTSFYGSHIITAMGFGGMVCFNNDTQRMRGMRFRDWGRVGGDDEDFDSRFANFEDIPYDSKFLYSEIGYNLKMNEAAAAFGLVQLGRLLHFELIRRRLFRVFYRFFEQWKDWFYLPETVEGTVTNWLAFPLTIKKAPFTRYEYLKHLHNHGIQVRVLFSGNITRHPVYQRNKDKFRIASKLDNADWIMANGFLIGCHQGMTEKDVEYVCDVSEQFFNSK